MRALEFSATEPGDWPFQCQKSRQPTHAMGRDVPTMISVDHRDVPQKIQKLLPDHMVMADRSMADTREMEMPLQDNTLPMMTGQGPVGPLEMGGMFTVVKVRDGLCGEVHHHPGAPWHVVKPRGGHKH